jgi:hypothetical protein
MSRRLTDLQLERFLAEAMGAPEKASVEQVLAGSPEDAEALRLLRAESEAFLFQHPPAPFAEKVVPAEKKRGFQWWWGALLATAAAVLLVLVSRPGGDDETRVKGDVAWAVRVNERTALSGMKVQTGDTLTFQVATAESGYVAVVSHAPDGWFVYVPTTRVEKGVSVLPTGARLDGQLGNETLFLVSSSDFFDAEGVKSALGANMGSPGISVESVSLIKTGP